MPKIQCLDPHLADLIAAGEVVERPASVVKELTENAIDAGATAVTVEIKRGGMSYLRVTDNGCGIAAEDAETAFLRHATSKIRTEYDLEAIGTLGFRGEALAAIAAVSKVELLTKTAEEDFGTAMVLEAGVVRERTETGCPNGTTMIVRDLFYNTPARLKFLKRDASEGAAVFAVVQHAAMSHPEVSFRFLREGKQELQTPGDGSLQSAVYAVLGRELALGYLPCKRSGEDISVEGFLSKPVCCRGTRGYQHFFVNGRYVKSRTMTAALEQAYANQKMVGKFPGCVLHLTTKLNAVDVNVHPTKTEVKFLNEKLLFDAVYYAVRFALEQEQEHPDALPEAPQKPVNGKPVNAAPAQPKKNFYQTMTAEQFRNRSVTLHDSAPIPGVTDHREHTPAERPAKKPGIPVPGESVPERAPRAQALNRDLLLGGLPETIPDEDEGWEEDTAPAPAPEVPAFRTVPRPEPVRRVNPVEPDLTVVYEEPEEEEQSTVSAEKVKPFPAKPGVIPEKAEPIAVKPEPVPAKPEAIPEAPETRPETPGQSPAPAEPQPAPAPVEAEPLPPLVEDTPAWRIAGEVLNTYIIVEQGDTVYLIDKHAAHERMNFDRLKARDYHAMSQILLTPLVLTLEPGEREVLLEHTALLREYGFEVEDFGGGTLVVRQVPDYLAEEETESTLSEIAGTLMTTGTADPSAARDSLLHTMACKSAIKGGWVNGEQELQVVAEAVMSGRVMYCPHGRPVAITMTKKQIEKQFKRIT